MGYNNCFCLGGPGLTKGGKVIKLRYFIDESGEAKHLTLKDNYEYWNTLSAAKARHIIDEYFINGKRQAGDQKLRVSLWLEGAKYDDLYIFVIDFDKVDGKVDDNTLFFHAAARLADKITRSMNGGYHMYFAINKEAARRFFDEMNLLQADQRKGFVNRTGCKTLEGGNKVDLFCDAKHFIYEWEEWDNIAPLTDKTEQLIMLLRDNFEFQRPVSVDLIDDWADADGSITLEGMDADTLKVKNEPRAANGL